MKQILDLLIEESILELAVVELFNEKSYCEYLKR